MRAQALIVLALAGPVSAAEWVVLAAPPVKECKAQPEVITFGPRGIEYVLPAPKCKEVDGGPNTFHLHGDHLVPAQQTVPAGTECVGEGRAVGGKVYRKFKRGGELWALCGKP